MAEPIKVLIVDDSAAVRQALSAIVAADPALAVSATAADPYVAAERIRQDIPDVILLDIELPRMDGLTFLRKIMAQRPIPVVICSSHVEDGSTTLMEALEAGALDVVTKPRLDTAQGLRDARLRIADAIKAAAAARFARRPRPASRHLVEAKFTADAVLPPTAAARGSIPRTGPVICLGASTGGTEALREVLGALPTDCPPIAIVQHMPAPFTAAFARRLDGQCRVRVREAEDGDALGPGEVLIAPGNRHMLLTRTGARYGVRLVDGPLVARHRPSVDVLFRSAAQCAGPNALGALLTGMGDDGAHGLLEMQRAGALTLAQNEETAIVFGMPREAIALGAARRVVPLGQVAREIAAFAASMAGA